jgi:hypothetical protein
LLFALLLLLLLLFVVYGLLEGFGSCWFEFPREPGSGRGFVGRVAIIVSEAIWSSGGSEPDWVVRRCGGVGDVPKVPEGPVAGGSETGKAWRGRGYEPGVL